MEALQVMPQDNTANILASLSGERLYNIGMGMHYFYISARNLEAAIKKYMPSKYIMIEGPSIKFSDSQLKEALHQKSTSYPHPDRGTLRLLLRKIPALRLLWINLKLKEFFKKTENDFIITENNSVLLSEVLKRMKNTASISGAKIIIAYHPSVSLNTDGTLKINSNPEDVKQFSDLCSQNGIYFLDVGERFLKEYEKNYTLPYGFTNTSVGTGHMNKYGHKMFAEEIYKLMQKIEAQS